MTKLIVVFHKLATHAYKSSMGTAYFLSMTKSVQTTTEADAHLADGEYLHEEIKLNVETERTKFKTNIIIIIIIIIDRIHFLSCPMQ